MKSFIPLVSRYLTEEERQQIIEGKTEKEQSKHKEPVPHFDLLTDIAIWSCLILFIAYYIGMINYQLYSPTFIKEVELIFPRFFFYEM